MSATSTFNVVLRNSVSDTQRAFEPAIYELEELVNNDLKYAVISSRAKSVMLMGQVLDPALGASTETKVKYYRGEMSVGVFFDTSEFSIWCEAKLDERLRIYVEAAASALEKINCNWLNQEGRDAVIFSLHTNKDALCEKAK